MCRAMVVGGRRLRRGWYAAGATQAGCPPAGEAGRKREGELNCPYCGHGESRVVDSRETEVKEAIRRRRECIACGQRFTTYEMIEQIPITVVKRNGSTELFDAEKLLRGLTRACAKRSVPVERLQAVVADIERQLRDESAYQVPSERVGKMALERLQSVDLVAYIRFASVYRQFDSVEGFKHELELLAKEGIR